MCVCYLSVCVCVLFVCMHVTTTNGKKAEFEGEEGGVYRRVEREEREAGMM